ncbi:tocopherol cyclase family protein [Saccharicrinis sp. FJH62]|uniref:tocopherol cyclase family protein n=1 Tax=Saccharicrinis sp. FJH62 TaxID=3344657 RepID=UPI0035D4CD8B
MKVTKRILPKVFHPEFFQSHKNHRRYFENWLFKLVSEDRNSVLVIIPVMELGSNQRCYVQFLNGITGETCVAYYDLSELISSKYEMNFSFGENSFSEKGIKISIDQKGFKGSGKIRFGELMEYPSYGLKRNVIGYLSFMPFQHIYYAVISMHHKISGSISINNQTLNFDNGTGFIEKTWGKYYPESWLYIGCNTFTVPDTYFVITVSTVNLGFTKILGNVGYFYYKGKLINLSFYTKTKFTKFDQQGKVLLVELTKGKHRIEISLIPRNKGKIKIPSATDNRYVSESADSTLHLNYFVNNELILSTEGEHAEYDFVEGLNDLISRKF